MGWRGKEYNAVKQRHLMSCREQSGKKCFVISFFVLQLLSVLEQLYVIISPLARLSHRRTSFLTPDIHGVRKSAIRVNRIVLRTATVSIGEKSIILARTRHETGDLSFGGHGTSS